MSEGNRDLVPLSHESMRRARLLLTAHAGRDADLYSDVARDTLEEIRGDDLALRGLLTGILALAGAITRTALAVHDKRWGDLTLEQRHAEVMALVQHACTSLAASVESATT